MEWLIRSGSSFITLYLQPASLSSYKEQTQNTQIQNAKIYQYKIHKYKTTKQPEKLAQHLLFIAFLWIRRRQASFS